MSQDRIKDKFVAIQQEGRTGLIMFLTAGFPDKQATLELVPVLVEAGADIIELGIPFSDPLAEGPTIQESSFRALQDGTTLADCLAMVEQLREQLPDTPLVLMGYYNPIYTYGLARFATECQRVGVDGVIVVDLPHAEVAPLAAECRPRGIHVIPLLAPTSDDTSIQASCAEASGFIYCISVTGVTGEREQVSQRAFQLLERVRQHTPLPLALGFGISRRQHVDAIGQRAQAVVVGSALVRLILDSPRAEVAQRASRLVAELAGTWSPVKGGAG